MSNEKKDNPILQKFLQEREAAGQREEYQQGRAEEPAEAGERIGRYKVADIEDSDGFRSVDMRKAPMALFYDQGTMVEIRAATTGEIQDYSTVDDNNLYDITIKMNAVLAKCARIRRADGTLGSYRDIKEGDRIFLITEISRLTTSTGNRLRHEVICPNDACNTVNDIEVSSENFVLQRPDDAFIEKYFNPATRAFDFKIKATGEEISLHAPSIGLAQDLTAYMVDRMSKKLKMNVSFMKCIPWILGDRPSLSVKGAEEHEFRFTKMNKDKFLFVNAAIDKMNFGIKELSKPCVKCGTEVLTPFTFPGGYSALFIVPNAFDDLVG